MFRQRMEYLRAGPSAGCFLCAGATAEDLVASLVLVRTGHSLVVMNRYPYNTGHLLISPRRHVAELEDLDAAERAEILDLTQRAVRVLREAMSAEGFNVGANLGAAAGAGVPGHLHVHVVPRWAGDTNFMPVTAGAKVLPETLDQTYARLRPGFAGA